MFVGREQLPQSLGDGPLNYSPPSCDAYTHQQAADCVACSCFTLSAAAAPSCVGQEDDAPADAESCCGEPMEDTNSRLADLDADFGIAQADCQDTLQAGEQQQHDQQQRQPQQHWYLQQHQQHHSSSQGACSSGGHSSGGCCSSGTAHMGDDFECMASEDVSMLLEDTAEYPGGIEAALADWAGACSSQLQAASCTAAAAAEPFLQQQPHQQAMQQMREQQPAATMPSLASLLVSPTPPPDLATSLLPCCQWGAFENDPVGDVLAGKAPVPETSCCSSGGLTDCLMGCWA